MMFFQVDNIAKLSLQLRLWKLGNILTMNTSSFNTSYLEGLGMPSTCMVLAQTPTSLVPFWSPRFSKSSDIQKLGVDSKCSPQEEHQLFFSGLLGFKACIIQSVATIFLRKHSHKMLERIGYGFTNISNQDLFAFFNNYALFVCTETKNDSLLSFLDFFWRGAFPNFHVIENATYFIRNLNSWGLWGEQNVQKADNNCNFKCRTRHFGSRLASAHTTITDFRLTHTMEAIFTLHGKGIWL